MIAATISCNKNDNINSETTISVKDTANTNIQQFNNIGKKIADANDLSIQEESMSSILNDILQQEYTWSEFNFIYPKYEITAQSQRAVNIRIPEFEKVIFVFSGNLEDNISEYKMVSANAPGNVLLPEYFGKTFDQIIIEEGNHVNYTLSDDFIQYLYKYEYIYIYRDNFYYFIRGHRHLNELTAEHVAMFRYDENQKRVDRIFSEEGVWNATHIPYP